MERKIAFFSDVHGNLHALEAILRHLEGRGVKEMACLGDLVGYGAFPNEVVALVREKGIPTLRGNYDDAVGMDKDDCGCAYRDPKAEALGNRSFEWTKEKTSGESKSFLASLPGELRWEVEGWKVLLVHGSPRKINEYLYADRSEESFRRIARAYGADAIAFGHTHRPFHKVFDGVHFINVGTAGKPVDGDPRVGYCVVTFGQREDGKGGKGVAKGGESLASLQVDFTRVGYDVEAAARAIESSGLPVEFAVLLRTGGVAQGT
jgi:putative phosphoesterase